MAVILESGIAIGALYALAALGMVLIYKTTGVVNFAQGTIAMMATFFMAQLLRLGHLPVVVALLVAMAFAAALGAVIEWGLVRRIQGAPILSSIILTLGLYYAFEGIAGILWGFTPQNFPAQIGGAVTVGRLSIPLQDIVAVLVLLVLTGALYAVFQYTMVGLAMRATFQRLSTARLMGIPAGRVFSSTWAVGSILGAIAGILIVPVTLLQPSMMDNVMLLAFAAAVFGGFNSIPGTIVGGILVGVVEAVVGGLWSSQIKDSVIFALIVLILYIKPTGLFGSEPVEKV
ncbi:MAG: branched-chain amino acid ABC transporter permease [Actinomycetia bacterium]|jgi:branched-chain amino acid transport system permease protein|nr:branched-chain amino acid ABC transporter permease [Actinomycetes bacterium]